MRGCGGKVLTFRRLAFLPFLPSATQLGLIAAMAKRKSRAEITVADGAGGMMKVEDRRFEKGDWPISFEIPPEDEQADRWTRYLRAECERRGWSLSSLGQLERAENSGTITVTAKGKPQLEIVWEHQRKG